MTPTENTQAGTALKSMRVKLGLSINDVSLSTKISPRILKALEECQYDELPPQSFTRGFIRSYSAYLKIDAQPILESYNQFLEAPASTPVLNHHPETTSIENHNNLTDKDVKANQSKYQSNNGRFRLTENSTLSRFLVVVGLLVSVAIIFAAKNIFDHYANDRIVPPAESTIETPTAIELPENSDAASAPLPPPVGAEEPVPTLVPAPTPVAAEEPKKPIEEPQKPIAEQIKTPPTPVVAAPVTAKPEPPAPATTKPEAPATTKPVTPVTTATPPPAPISKKENPQEVIIQALDKVELVIQIDGGEQKKIILAPDNIHTIKAKTSISLDIKDGGMVNLIHNGKDKGVPGDLGKPTHIKFP